MSNADSESQPFVSSSKKAEGKIAANPEKQNGPSDMNLRLSCAIAAGAFGSAFQHGYHTGVLNAPQALIMDWVRNCPEGSGDSQFNMTSGNGGRVDDCPMSKAKVTMIWAWIVAIFCVGGMIGGSAVSVVAGKLGRKGGLLLNNVLVLIACGCMLVSKRFNSFELIIAGRLLIGINAGLNAGLAPMYLSEIAPIALRGALIITISVLLSQILGMTNILGNDGGWPWLLALSIIPGIIQLATLPFCPESPKYLLLDKDDDVKANEALVWLRGKVDVHEEMDEMRAEQETAKVTPKVTLKEMFKNSSLRQPLFIAMMMMLAQQLSGINAAMFFSTSIFLSAGLDEIAAESATLGMGVVNLAMTFVSMVLIERAGRKTLMLAGLSVMGVSTTLLMISLLAVSSVPWMSYLSIASVICFVIGISTGPGSIPWFFVSELFTQSGRPHATSIAVVTNWSANFLVGLGFSPLQLAIGPYVFVIFIINQFLFILYVYFKVPETKNRTIEEITAQFRKDD